MECTCAEFRASPKFGAFTCRHVRRLEKELLEDSDDDSIDQEEEDMALIGTEPRIEVTFTREELKRLLDTFHGDTLEQLPDETLLWVEPERVRFVEIGVHNDCRADMTFRYE
jgi:hypothetical protein